MRSPFAYTPRPGPLQAASPGAAVLYLGSFVTVAFLYSNPIVLAAAGAAAVLAGRVAGGRDAVRAALRMSLALAVLIVAVNALVVSRGETVLLRLGEWPLLGRVDVTAEALAAGAVIGLRAAVTMVAFAVYSACVDPDRVLRALRPHAGRSALTASLVSRLVPVAAADAARLRDAGRLRGPGAAPLSRAALARRLLTGSLDRAVDVAATLELRGYGLRHAGPAAAGTLDASPLAGRAREVSQAVRARRMRPRPRPRHDARFCAVGLAVLVCAIAGKALGADAFAEYPGVEIAAAPITVGLAAVLVLAGLAPLRRGPRRGGGSGGSRRGVQPQRAALPASRRSRSATSPETSGA
jgi:energy-coupling factor transport system permease protein